jgi:CRP-like cAMP-binding protein
MLAKQGDCLYRLGDPSNRIFFLGLGKIEIVSREEKCLKVLSVGAAIREGSLFGNQNRIKEY